MVRLASGIAAATRSYILQINQFRSGVSGTVILKDDTSGQQLRGPRFVSIKDYRLKAGRILVRLKVAACGSSRLKAVPAESRLKAWSAP